MRILLLSHYFEPENGAPQRRWRALIERFTRAGHTVDVIAPVPHYPEGQAMLASARPGTVEHGTHGARVHRVGFLPHDGTIARRTLDHVWVARATEVAATRLVRSGSIDPDLVIATAPALPTLWAGSRIARRHRIPLVMELRDAWPDLVSFTPGLRTARSLKSRVKQSIHDEVTLLQREADAVITTTETFAEVLRGRGIRRVEVIRNGTEPGQYEVVGTSRDEHAELRVLYMGTIGRSQGLDVLIDAAAELQRRGVAADVRIVGGGIDVHRLRAHNARVGDPVDIRPVVAPSEVLDHYRWADTCVVSLRDWAPFRWTVPSKLYELMATGRHVTALLDGEGADIVREAECGLVSPPGDAAALADRWARLARHRGTLEINGGGRDWVREHAAYDRLAEHYLALLDDVLVSA